MSRKNWSDEQLFSRLLHNKSEKSYWENLRELRIRGSQHIFVRSIALTHSENLHERIAGVHILAQLGGSSRPYRQETIDRYFQMLPYEQDDDLISSILYGIGHNTQILSTEHVSMLTNFNVSDNRQILDALVHALMGSEQDCAIDRLISLSNSRFRSVRDWATFAIGSQIKRDSSDIRAALWRRVSDKGFRIRNEAILGLAHRKDERIIDVLKSELALLDNHGSPILEAIEELEHPEFITLLVQKLASSRQDTLYNRDWIINSINELKARLKNKFS